MVKSTFLIVRCSLFKYSHWRLKQFNFWLHIILMALNQTRYWSWLLFEAAHFTAKLQITFAKAIFYTNTDVCPLFDQLKCATNEKATKDPHRHKTMNVDTFISEGTLFSVHFHFVNVQYINGALNSEQVKAVHKTGVYFSFACVFLPGKLFIIVPLYLQDEILQKRYYL